MAVQVILSIHPEDGYVTVQDYEFVDLLRAGLILSYQDPNTGVGIPGVPQVFTPQQRDELTRAYLPKWTQKTAYPVSATIINPSGQIVIANVTHSSGLSYIASKWDLASGVQPADVAGAVDGLRGELAATSVTLWKASTAYKAGQAVLNPSGAVVTALADFTSGSTYDPTKWSTPPGSGFALVDNGDGTATLNATGTAKITDNGDGTASIAA